MDSGSTLPVIPKRDWVVVGSEARVNDHALEHRDPVPGQLNQHGLPPKVSKAAPSCHLLSEAVEGPPTFVGDPSLVEFDPQGSTRLLQFPEMGSPILVVGRSESKVIDPGTAAFCGVSGERRQSSGSAILLRRAVAKRISMCHSKRVHGFPFRRWGAGLAGLAPRFCFDSVVNERDEVEA